MKRDPRAIRFIDWWERVEYLYPDHTWPDALSAWAGDLALSDEDLYEIHLDASAERNERRWRDFIRSRTDVPGMVIGDFENIPDNDEAA